MLSNERQASQRIVLQEVSAGKYKYSRTSLSRMAKIQGICPGQRIIRDNELSFGAKQFRIQGISSGTAGDPVERNPGQRGATSPV